METWIKTLKDRRFSDSLMDFKYHHDSRSINYSHYESFRILKYLCSTYGNLYAFYMKATNSDIDNMLNPHITKIMSSYKQDTDKYTKEINAKKKDLLDTPYTSYKIRYWHDDLTYKTGYKPGDELSPVEVIELVIRSMRKKSGFNILISERSIYVDNGQFELR